MERTGYASNAVNDTVDQLLANGVVATSIYKDNEQGWNGSSRHTRLTVVGSILLASDHSLRVEESAICAGADLIDDIGLEVDIE